MVYGLNAEGRFCLWNRECERVLGYAKADILGRTRLELFERMYPDASYQDWVLRPDSRTPLPKPGNEHCGRGRDEASLFLVELFRRRANPRPSRVGGWH